MAIGQKVGNIAALKKRLEASQGDAVWIKYIPESGMTVRFMTDPEEWWSYWEHYDQSAKKYYPCVSPDRECVGCQTNVGRTMRYLANAVNLDDNDRVIPLKLPVSLVNRLYARYEKWHTLMDRDIELMRSGKNKDTEYDLDAGSPDKRKFPKAVPHDLSKVLEAAYDDIFGPDEDLPAKPKKKDKDAEVKKPRPRPHATFDDTVPESGKVKEKKVKKNAVPDFTSRDLEAMSLGRLRATARDNNIDPRGKTEKDLRKEIVKVLDLPPF